MESGQEEVSSDEPLSVISDSAPWQAGRLSRNEMHIFLKLVKKNKKNLLLFSTCIIVTLVKAAQVVYRQVPLNGIRSF